MNSVIEFHVNDEKVICIVYNAMYLVILSCLLEGIAWLTYTCFEARWRILRKMNPSFLLRSVGECCCCSR